MDDDALIYSYDLFKGDGYNGSIEEYKQLLGENADAVEVSYGLMKKDKIFL